MKKIIPICVAGFLLFTAFGAVALENDAIIQNDANKGNREFTHTVFAEDATATWCGYCHYAREALDKIYTSGDYPFWYVCLVDDKNTVAAQRNLEYNVYGFPTVFFDGGYKVSVGGGTGNEAQYRNYINQCGSRAVKDIDVILTVDWLGNAAMDISASVVNNEGTQYDGHIHVYVTEIESSMGWKDTTGHPYTFPFLNYAFNEDILIAAGNTWSNSITWDGNDYGYGSIQYGNIAVIAVVFNSEWHQGYAYPPSSNPFDAYYVDDTAGVLVADTGPYTPSSPSPADGATNIDVNADLSWTGGGSPGLTITYDVYFGTTGSPPKVSSNQSTTSYNPGTLGYTTQYYWKIVAWDENLNSATGPVWSFTTMNNPDNPPQKPTVSGTKKGKVGTTYTYTIIGIDPDTDQIYGFVDWGDNTTTDWVGPYNSGESFTVDHTWGAKGTYTVKVKVKDEHGLESDWATLDVTMPKDLGFANTFLNWLFEQFPHAFPILRYLLGA